MYQADYWNTKSQYFAPMAMINGTKMFTEDFVSLKWDTKWETAGWSGVMGKIERFFKKVRYCT